MDVVEDDEQRPISGDPSQEGGGRVEQPEAVGLRVERRRLGHVGEELAELREQLSDVGRAATELLAERCRCPRPGRRSHRLHPRPVGGRASGLPAAAPEDADVQRSRSAGELVGEPTLADARLPREDDELSSTHPRFAEGGLELGELSLAADEERGRRVGRPRVGSGARWRGRRRIEHGFLVEDRALQLLQRAARVDPELVGEHPAGILVRVERLRLPTTAVQGQHELPAQPLAEGVLRQEPLELRDEIALASELELGVESILERGEAQLVEARDLGLGEGLVAEVGQRRPSPE